MKISKENTDKSRIFAFMFSEVIVSLNFTSEKFMARYIPIKKCQPFFILIF